MAQQKITKQLIRVVSDIGPDLLQKIDEERPSHGNCSRSAIIRLALMERYGKRKPKHP